jgi:hypothetical protein
MYANALNNDKAASYAEQPSQLSDFLETSPNLIPPTYAQLGSNVFLSVSVII